MMEAEVQAGGANSGPRMKKKSLKNKALAVSFNEKDLNDYVTGFHKRKKKRRKVAQKQNEEAQRRNRIELRRKRKLERDLAYGTAAPEDGGGGAEEDKNEDEDEDEDGDEAVAPISGTKTYDNGDMKVTVTTSEISREESEDVVASAKPRAIGPERKPSVAVPVSKKKIVKRVSRKKPMQRKRDKRKGKEQKKPTR